MTLAADISECIHVLQALKERYVAEIQSFADLCLKAIASGNTIYFMGNGGSAADSQHLAAEIVGRFEKVRRGLSAVALTTDTSILTAVGNDLGFEEIFRRQVDALVREGDVVVGLSTSGKSRNVIRALQLAKQKGAVTVGLTGRRGSKMAEVCDLCIKVPSDRTARIQEAHIVIGHILCRLIEEGVSNV